MNLFETPFFPKVPSNIMLGKNLKYLLSVSQPLSKQRILKRAYGASGKRVHVDTKEFFDTSSNLVAKRNPEGGRLHFAFLEGTAGSGKGELLERLKKVGYTTRTYPYVDFCKSAWHTSQYAPHSAVVSMIWLAEWTRDLEQLEQAFQAGHHHKDNIIFLQRSPLSLWVHYVSRLQPPSHTNVWLRVFDEIRARFSTSAVLCYSDTIKVQQRVALRQHNADEEEKKIRTELFEEDLEMQQLFDTRYGELAEKGWLDGRVATTSVKQGQAQIIKSYGLDNWDAFKEIINKSAPEKL